MVVPPQLYRVTGRCHMDDITRNKAPDTDLPGTERPVWSIIIPAYNEEKRIGPTLRKAWDYLASRGESFEVIVVDDGSTDGTVDLVRRDFPDVRILKNPGNRGKGYSVRNGLLSARGERLLFSDADLSTPIEEMEAMADRLREGADVVIASRALPDSVIEVRQHWWREMSGRVFNRIVRTISGLPFPDTQCGFKAYRRDAARRICNAQRIEGWAFDVEHLVLSRRMGLRIAQVPVRWVNSAASRLSFWRDATKMLIETMKIRMTRYDLSKSPSGSSNAIEPFKTRWMFFAGRAIFRTIFGTYYRFECHGRDSVPKQGGLLLVSNHASNLDPPLLGAAMRRPVHYMAKRELFELPILGPMLRSVNAHPVKRGTADRAAIRESLDLLRRGEIVVVFPEGTRTSDGELQQGKPGVSMIAAQAGVPCLPVYIDGTFRSMPRGCKFPRPGRLKVTFGEPFDLPSAGDGQSTKTYFQDCADRMMERIAALKK
jgi:dolichyl-phosphate beta-glucosyltransferase